MALMQIESLKVFCDLTETEAVFCVEEQLSQFPLHSAFCAVFCESVVESITGQSIKILCEG